MSKYRAVVFAYHDIGVRCLEVLLELDIAVDLVVTHEDDPGEHIWFDSVAKRARCNDIPVLAPRDPNTPGTIKRIESLAPDLLFSFYYRQLLCAELIETPRIAALNMHGSLLPKYRGRVPVNWAILHGEKLTGVSLHRMVVKPDAGAVIARRAVPIIRNDTAGTVFGKQACAAESLLLETLPQFLRCSIEEDPKDLDTGSYFGARHADDGRIDWRQGAGHIHNLIRAVAPPYPGAFFDLDEGGGVMRIMVLGSYFRNLPATGRGPRLYIANGEIWADCVDGKRFLATRIELQQTRIDEAGFKLLFGTELVAERLKGTSA